MSNQITPLSPASASLSSLGTTTLKRKQMMEPPAKKTEVPTAVYFDSAADYSHPLLLLDSSPPPVFVDELPGISSAKKAKTSGNFTQQPAAAVHNDAMKNPIEREWELAAARINGDNAFGYFLASIGQLPSQIQPQQQQLLPLPQLQQQLLLPLPLPLPIVSKPAPFSNAKKPATLSKAKKNKMEAQELIFLVHEVQIDDDDDDEIYDSCPEVAEKIRQFLLLDGVQKKIFLDFAVYESDSYVTLKTFLDGINQSQCRNKLYGKAYIFFEKLRLLEGREKSEERLRNEALYPFGFSTKKKQKSEAQIVSHDLLRKGAVRCEGGGEMDERSSETDLKCYDQFA